MARIPVRTASRQLETSSAPQYSSSNPLAGAVANLGGTLMDVASEYQRQNDAVENFDKEQGFQQFKIRAAGQMPDIIAKAPASGQGIHDSAMSVFDAQANEFLATVPERLKPRFEALTATAREQWANSTAADELEQRNGWYRTNINTSMETAREQVFNDPAQFNAARDQIFRGIDSSGLPEAERQELRRKAEQNISLSIAQRSLEENPASLASGLGIARAPLDSETKTNYLNLAQSFAGQNEANDSKALAEFIKKACGIEIDPKQTAWCAAFVNGILGANGIEGTGSLAAKSFLKFGTATDKPEVGDIVVLNRTNNPAFGHVGFYQGTDENGNIRILGGNQGNAVNVRSYPADSVAGFRKPPSVTSEKAGEQLASLPAGGPSQGMVIGQADPRLAGLTFDQKMQLMNQAEAKVKQQQTAAQAEQKALQTQTVDSYRLRIATGEGSLSEMEILQNPALDDGDKATLVTSFREKNGANIQAAADVAAMSSGTLAIDPYSSKDRTRVDNLYSTATQGLGADQAAAVTSTIIQQTGLVPQTVLNDLRRGVTSQSVQDVVAAAQSAQRISSFDPSVLGRREGGGEVQKTADDFSYMINKLNMTPEAAAQRIIDNRNPEKQFARKALEPAAKEFVKSVEGEDLSAAFDESFVPFNDPQLGVTPAQEAGIKAEYLAIAEDQFYQSNGDADLAKNRAMEQMKRLYGVSEIGGNKVVMKHPPERFWPKLPEAGFLGFEGDPLGYAKKQLQEDIASIGSTVQEGSVNLVATPETDAMVKRGELPGYAVLYKDADGVYQTIPGKLWRPEVNPDQVKARAAEEQAVRVDNAQFNQAENHRRLETQALPDGGRSQSLDAFLAGPQQAPSPDLEIPAVGEPSTQDRLRERRDELFENAPTGGGGDF